jgi:hypothetical protein
MGSITDIDSEFMPKLPGGRERRICPHCNHILGNLTDVQARKVFPKHEAECQVKKDREELVRLRALVDGGEAGKPIFKILKKSTGEFSCGGSSPRFSKKGKIWTGIGPLKLHMAHLHDSSPYQGCEIITIQPVILERIDAQQFVQNILNEKQAKATAKRERAARRRQEALDAKERADYERLKEKFEK